MTEPRDIQAVEATPQAPAPHLLVVDDEVIAAMALERFLSRKGFRISRAANGEQALDVFAQTPADLVVTDVRMPRMSGPELVRQLRAAQPDLPVVVVTGYMGEDPETAGLTGPRTRVMTKPVDPEALLRAVRQLLDVGQG